MMAPKGGDFNAALQKEYVMLAKAEAAEYDWSDVGLFNGKASMAARGEKVEPQNIADRNIPKAAVPALSSSRSRLIASLEAGGAVKAPQHAARAQAMFDCWMQEQEENFQPDDIAACRAGFNAAMADLDAAMTPKQMAKPMPAPAKPMPAPKPMAMAPVGPFTVYFAHNSAVLDDNAKAVVVEAMAAAKKHKAIRVRLNGFADRSGKSDYNWKLSDRRVNAVADLVVLGVPKKNIVSGAYGETQTMVQTPDGAREGKNRRVEIMIDR